MRRATLVLLLITATMLPAVRAVAEPPVDTNTVWQWSVPVAGDVSSETGELPRAFLYIPPGCTRVRAVVVGQHNMEEEGILQHPAFRAMLAKQNVAAVWITPAFDPYFRFDRNAGERFNTMMANLATESGYAELANAPIIPIGHSAMASFPWSFAVWNPERTLAALSVSGQWPLVKEDARPLMDTSRLHGVPGLVSIGEYEWADERAGEGLKERAAQPGMPLTMIAEPGGGHFDFSDAKVELLAFYVQKALEHRLPKTLPPVGQPTSLRVIDPTRDGWLVERWHTGRPSQFAPAPVAMYKHDPKDAFWCFDGELARALEQFGNRYRGKKVALTGYVQNGQIVPQVNGTHQQVTLPFLPDADGDGLTFTLSGTFLDTVPAGRPERWTGKKAGDTVERPGDNTAKVTISRICGPVVAVGQDKWALHFDRVGTNNVRRSNEIWLLASYAGNDTFRRSVQQSVLRFPRENKDGAEQTIQFPAITNQKAGTKSISLFATSSAKIPVYYYVLAGPAVIENNQTLRFTAIPPRAKYPVKVTVVAWQWGRSVVPKLKTAVPVTRTFYLEK